LVANGQIPNGLEADDDEQGVDVDCASEEKDGGDGDRGDEAKRTDEALPAALQEQVEGPEKGRGAEGEEAELGQDLNDDGGGVNNGEGGHGVDVAAQATFGEGRDEETVGERGPDDGHAAGEKGDPGENADMQAGAAECEDSERKYHRENDRDESSVNEAIGGADLRDRFQRLGAAADFCDRMMRDGDEHQERAGSEDETGNASLEWDGRR